MTLHSDQKLIDLGRQFDDAIRQARILDPKRLRSYDDVERLAEERGVKFEDKKAWRALQIETGHEAIFKAFCKHHSEAFRIMKAIHREKASTLAGFAVKCRAVAFDQFDLSVDPKERHGDVAEKQLLRLSRQMAAAVKAGAS